jgi:uroporphyrinogen decarboxylase
VNGYKEAGAKWVMHHSDGNVLPLLDMWIDAGIDAINPVEYRSGMDAVAIRDQYGQKLVLVGGLDNTGILPRGDRSEIRTHVEHLLSIERGYVFGPHSIGSDIALQTMAYVRELLDQA